MANIMATSSAVLNGASKGSCRLTPYQIALHFFEAILSLIEVKLYFFLDFDKIPKDQSTSFIPPWQFELICLPGSEWMIRTRLTKRDGYLLWPISCTLFL